MRIAFLTQDEYKTFKQKVKNMKANGIKLDFDVFQPKKRKVKVVLNKDYDNDLLDEMSKRRPMAQQKPRVYTEEEIRQQIEGGN